MSSLILSDDRRSAGFPPAASGEIPSERVVPLTVNRGNPAVLSEPSADFSQAIRKLAAALQPAPAEKKRRLLGALARA